MKHDLNHCCGTTCDRKKNLDYVTRLEAEREELIKIGVTLRSKHPDTEKYRKAARRLREIIWEGGS